MGKGSFIAIVALLVAVAGAIVAFAAYFRRRGCSLCDDMDEVMDEGDADLDYYATHIEEDSDEAEETSEPEQQEEAVAEEAPVEESEKSEDIPE